MLAVHSVHFSEAFQIKRSGIEGVITVRLVVMEPQSDRTAYILKLATFLASVGFQGLQRWILVSKRIGHIRKAFSLCLPIFISHIR
jgi:hypothetical protein